MTLDRTELDLLDLYQRASEWTKTKVAGATTKLDERTVCDAWDAHTLLNHMVQTQNYFAGSARGEDVSPPSTNPPELLGDDPLAVFDQACSETVRVFKEPGVIEKTGPALGIAFSDQLLHGWDLAASTGQTTTMPRDLPEVAYKLIHGQFTEDQRKGVFKPELPVAPDASAQDKFLAYTGRDPNLAFS